MSAGFVAFDIGCLECGESSGVVGVFGTKAEAQEAMEAARSRQAADWRGQHHFTVINLAQPELSDYAPDAPADDGAES